MEKWVFRRLRDALYNFTKHICCWDPTFVAYLVKKRAEGNTTGHLPCSPKTGTPYFCYGEIKIFKGFDGFRGEAARFQQCLNGSLLFLSAQIEGSRHTDSVPTSGSSLSAANCANSFVKRFSMKVSIDSKAVSSILDTLCQSRTRHRNGYKSA